MNEHNWAGNLSYSSAVRYPASLEELRQIVLETPRLRVLGSKHSFNAIADSEVALVSLERMPQVFRVDARSGTVSIGGGMRYGDFVAQLDQAGRALHNLASLPHISVAGACATATHGSGDANRNLADAVTELELMTAAGDLVRLSRTEHPEHFRGAVVGLGALGVVTRLTLETVPSFQVRQDVYEGLRFSALEHNFDAIFAGYSVSLFTDWQRSGWQEGSFHQVWRKCRVEGPNFAAEPEWFGARLALEPRHMIPGLPSTNTTPQLGVPGPWFERLPHFRLDHTPSSGEELQSEYFVPRQRALEAVRAVFDFGPELSPILQVSELRTIAADDLWLSPCYERDSLGLHFTWVKDAAAVARVLPRLEARLAPFEARPHWGKVFSLPPAHLRALYPKLPEFRALAHQYDPEGKFRNAFVNRYLFSED